MTSVLSFSWSRRTRRHHWFEKESSRADKKFGNSSTEGTASRPPYNRPDQVFVDREDVIVGRGNGLDIDSVLGNPIQEQVEPAGVAGMKGAHIALRPAEYVGLRLRRYPLL